LPDEPSVIWNKPKPDEELRERIDKLKLSNHRDIVDPVLESRINGGLMPPKTSSNRLDQLEKTNTEPAIKSGKTDNRYTSNILSGNDVQQQKPLTKDELREKRLKKLDA